MSVVPHRFLVRLSYACPYVANLPGPDAEVELPDDARLDPFADIDRTPNFADVRLGWNESGVGLAVEVSGKNQVPMGDASRPRQSDGVTLWLDTRGDRTGHRATRTCHQFHFLAAGGGDRRDEPTFLQTKIARALVDAPLASDADVPFRCDRSKSGYRIEAFLPAAVLTGFDPDQYPKLGVYYAVRDFERGEQTPTVGPEFPFDNDPSLWATLELVR